LVLRFSSKTHEGYLVLEGRGDVDLALFIGCASLIASCSSRANTAAKERRTGIVFIGHVQFLSLDIGHMEDGDEAGELAHRTFYLVGTHAAD